MAKHIHMTKPSEMPRKGSPSYHPLQNILSGVDYLLHKSASLWIPGKRMCLDEVQSEIYSLAFFHFLPVFQFFGSEFQRLTKVF